MGFGRWLSPSDSKNMILIVLVYAYFIAGISGSLFACFAHTHFGPSNLFLHGKAAINGGPSKGGKLVNWISEWTVSKHLFWHFYALGFISSIGYCAFFERTGSFIPALILVAQCLRRLFECFCVMPGGKDSQMHLIHYLIGISYYPVLLMSFSINQSRNAGGTINYYSWIGLFVFASGLQCYCHWILGQERMKIKKSQAPPSCSHRPLTNPLFRFIHAPHYFAELLIYLSIAGLNQFHPLSLLNLIWIISILGVSAKNSADWLTQKWEYKSHKDFCKYLMIPFLF